MASIPLLRLYVPPSGTSATRKLSPISSFSPSSASVAARLHHPLRSVVKISLSRPNTAPSRARTRFVCNYNPSPATDRLISAVAYCLPLFNGLQYGRFLFSKYPALGAAFEPILPFLSFYRSVPYASFVAFFALYLGVARNPRFSQFVRFNVMQAVVLDVLLVLPIVLQQIFNPGRSGLGYKLLVMGYNVLFVFLVSCFVYCVVCSILGRTPYLPFVAEAASRQL